MPFEQSAQNPPVGISTSGFSLLVCAASSLGAIISMFAMVHPNLGWVAFFFLMMFILCIYVAFSAWDEFKYERKLAEIKRDYYDW